MENESSLMLSFIILPSKRTRGLSRNICLQELKFANLVQFRPHTLMQAERQSSGSLHNTKGNKSNGEHLGLSESNIWAFFVYLIVSTVISVEIGPMPDVWV